MPTELLLFFLLALACEIVGTVAGFGSSVFFVPMAGFFFPVRVVLGLTSVFHVFSNLSKIILFRRHVDLRLTLLFGVPSVLLVLLGAWFTTRVSSAYAELALGVFLVGFSLVFLLFPRLELPPTRANAVLSGGVAGFLAGFVGTGGAVRGASLAAFNLEKNLFVGTSAAIDMGVDFSRMLVYVGHEFLGREHLAYLPALAAASWLGSYAGKRLLNRIPQAAFKRIVLGLLLAIGLLTVGRWVGGGAGA